MLGALLFVSACGTTPSRAPTPQGVLAADCRSLIAAIPDNLVLGGHRRPASPALPYQAAFGTPAVTVRCGVSVPTYDPQDEVEVVDGVGWLQLPPGHGAEHLVSFQSRTVVQVDIPHRYLPANVLPALSPLVARYGSAPS